MVTMEETKGRIELGVGLTCHHVSPGASGEAPSAWFIPNLKLGLLSEKP